MHEDAVGADRGRGHPQAGFFSGDAVEDGEDEGGAVFACGGVRRTREGGKEAVQGALGDRSGLPKQFVEQVVCVFWTERPSADTLCGSGEGGMGTPGG